MTSQEHYSFFIFFCCCVGIFIGLLAKKYHLTFSEIGVSIIAGALFCGSICALTALLIEDDDDE